MNKPELLRWFTEEQQKWELLLTAIGPKRMDQAGVNGEWSMRDVVAHLTGWQRRLVAQLKAAKDGQSKPPAPWPETLKTDDEVNAWIYESNRTRSAHQVLDDAHQLHEDVRAVIQALPDEVRIEMIASKFPVVWLN